jgi:hypothetical protein
MTPTTLTTEAFARALPAPSGFPAGALVRQARRTAPFGISSHTTPDRGR